MIPSIAVAVVTAYTVFAFVNWEYHPKYWSQDARIAASMSLLLAAAGGAFIHLVTTP